MARQAHHVRRLQGVLVPIYQGQNRGDYTDCGVGLRMQSAQFTLLYTQRGGCCGIRRTRRIHYQFQRAAQKCFSSGVRALPTGWPRLMRRLYRQPLTARGRPNPPWLSRKGPNPAPALPISNLVSADKYALRPNSCRVRFPNFVTTVRHIKQDRSGNNWDGDFANGKSRKQREVCATPPRYLIQTHCRPTGRLHQPTERFYRV